MQVSALFIATNGRSDLSKEPIQLLEVGLEEFKTTSVNVLSEISLLIPIFLPGSSKDYLESSPSFVGVSILPNSPLLTEEGSWQFISFLALLPNQSLIFLADGLNRHNVKAMTNMKKRNKVPSDEDALNVALKEGDIYHECLLKSIEHLESCQPDNIGKITLVRWKDIENEVMKKKQKVIHRHYEELQVFKERVGNNTRLFSQ